MRRSGSNLASYVLFEEPFCRALMRLGYRDAMARRDPIVAFLRNDMPALAQPGRSNAPGTDADTRDVHAVR